tara:strand:- start:5779 stop:7350 length:1572 start_codon:yes stop_codon:yes gene_type:complete
MSRSLRSVNKDELDDKENVPPNISETLISQGWVITPRIAEILDSPHVEQRTDQWFEARKHLLTGSRVDAVLGNNAWVDYNRLVNEMAGVSDGERPPRPELSLTQKNRNQISVEWPKGDVTYCVIDLETNRGCETYIIQISVQLVDVSGRVLSEFDELVKIDLPVNDGDGDESNPSIHGITEQQLEDKYRFSSIGKNFVSFIQRNTSGSAVVILVAYNGFSSDFRLLAKELARNHLALPRGRKYLCLDPMKILDKEWIDENVCQKTSVKQVTSMKLKDVTCAILRELGHKDEDFERLCGQAHDAMADVRALRFILFHPTIIRQQGKNVVLKWDIFTQFASKYVEYQKYELPKEIDQNSVDHGTRYEDQAIRKYEELHPGVMVREVGLIKHPVYNFLGASPDGIVLSKNALPRILEIKCPYKVFKHTDKNLKRENIDTYRGQLQLEMHVTGCEQADFFQFKPEQADCESQWLNETVNMQPDFINNPIFKNFMKDVNKRRDELQKKSRKRKSIALDDDDLQMPGSA